MRSEAQQLELYASDVADTAKLAGMTAARIGDPDGFDLACDVIRWLARGDTEFCADDVQRLASIRSNAIGAAFNALRREGVIFATGYRPSTRQTRHGNPIRTWQGRR